MEKELTKIDPQELERIKRLYEEKRKQAQERGIIIKVEQ
jgi:hypothetical protein